MDRLAKHSADDRSYEKAMEAEIQHAVEFQEKTGLDLFVHGEPERNDMVQYFGEQLTGFIFTQVSNWLPVHDGTDQAL